jgi:hypothetical protein
MREKAFYESVLQQLSNSGPVGAETVAYLNRRRVPLRFGRHNPAVGALWTLWGAIHINSLHFSTSDFSNPRLLSLVVHEARHLQQGPVVALSVYGELDAWQVDFNFQKAITGSYPHSLVAELCSLPLALDRDVLEKARALMKQYAGKGYRVDLLPLFPLPRELAWRFGRFS